MVNYMKEILDEITFSDLEAMTDDELQLILEYLNEYELEEEYHWLIDAVLGTYFMKTPIKRLRTHRG